MKTIERKKYLNWLIKWKNQQIIKVVTGVRRCGKSTLFTMFQRHLMQQGIRPDQIIALNFEDLALEHLQDYRKLYSYLMQRINTDEMNYIFLDEIQHVEHFEKAVDTLFLKENCDIYITGSNAYLLSGELATLLTGRYVELSMMPLSFAEYCEGLGDTTLSITEKFNRYITTGSFPYVLKYGFGESEAKEYMTGIYHTILINDVVKRLKIADVNMLTEISEFMLHNIGNRTSPNTIANTMTSNHKKIDCKTVDKYIHGLTDSLLLYEVRRYDIKGKQFFTTMNKFYACDIGMRNMLVRGKDSDIGHILENIVYLELRRRFREVYIGTLGSTGEIDFVVLNNGSPMYFQVSQTTLEESCLKRELTPLLQIKDNYPKFLLTLDEVFGEMDYDGVKKINVLKWLISE